MADKLANSSLIIFEIKFGPLKEGLGGRRCAMFVMRWSSVDVKCLRKTTILENDSIVTYKENFDWLMMQ